LIEEARRALRGGDPARALTLLETCRRLFPEGPLEREREWLTIQSLVGTVRGRDAKDRAAAFLKKFPDDPHARDLRAMGLAPKESR
jgi:outer membrane protein assembly factor BamD (BamD/ComL family)